MCSLERRVLSELLLLLRSPTGRSMQRSLLCAMPLPGIRSARGRRRALRSSSVLLSGTPNGGDGGLGGIATALNRLRFGVRLSDELTGGWRLLVLLLALAVASSTLGGTRGPV